MPQPHELTLQDAAPPPYPTQFHPEFGYLAPQRPFRRNAWLACKATLFGAFVGALAVIALVPSREPPVVQFAQANSFAPPPPMAPGDRWHLAPAVVPYVPPTLAMPVAAAVSQQRAGAAASLRGGPASPPPIAETPPAAPRALPSEAKKKAARQPSKRPQDIRPSEPDPRSAYAGSVRRLAEPPRERRGFWNW
jgi:hypothetical protein